MGKLVFINKSYITKVRPLRWSIRRHIITIKAKEKDTIPQWSLNLVFIMEEKVMSRKGAIKTPWICLRSFQWKEICTKYSCNVLVTTMPPPLLLLVLPSLHLLPLQVLIGLLISKHLSTWQEKHQCFPHLPISMIVIIRCTYVSSALQIISSSSVAYEIGTINNVYCVPKLSANLLYVYQITKIWMKVEFWTNKFLVKDINDWFKVIALRTMDKTMKLHKFQNMCTSPQSNVFNVDFCHPYYWGKEDLQQASKLFEFWTIIEHIIRTRQELVNSASCKSFLAIATLPN